MELRDYLHKNRIKVAQFCRRINYTPPYLYRIVNQTKMAGDKLARIIEKETNGEVTYAELMNPKKELK